MAEEIHRPHPIPSTHPMHSCIAGRPFPSHPWALRPTALKVRRSRRPPFRVREGRGPAGAGLPESINGENIKAVPEPTWSPIADDDNGGSHRVYALDGSAEIPREDSPGPHQPANFASWVGGCGEVSQSCASPPRQPQTTRHMSHSPLSFPRHGR